jgi:hypothetical protein
MNSELKIFLNDCEELRAIDPSHLGHLFSNFRKDIRNQVNKEFVRKLHGYEFDNHPDPESDIFCFDESDDCISFYNSVIRLRLFLGITNPEIYLTGKPISDGMQKKWFSDSERRFEIHSNWVKVLSDFGEISKSQLDRIAKIIKTSYSKLVVSVSEGKVESMRIRISTLDDERMSLLKEKDQMTNELKKTELELAKAKSVEAYDKGIREELSSKLDRLGSIHSEIVEQELEKITRGLPIADLIAKIDFPERHESYSYTAYPGNYTHKEVAHVRNYSKDHFFTFFQGELIMMSQIFNWHAKGPCDTPGSVLSHNLFFKLIDGNTWEAIELSSDVVSVLYFKSLKEFL